MEKDLHKRLEEAAEKYVASREDGVTVKVDKGSMEETVLKLFLELCHSDYIAGAEYGYKEAIALAKEWLSEHAKYYYHFNEKDLLSNFEKYMNKL